MACGGRRVEIHRGLFSTRVTLYGADGTPIYYQDTYPELRFHQRPLGLLTLCAASALLGAGAAFLLT